jgi:hypothetical protein
MGMCMSSNIDEAEQKKKSQAIDKILEEDSKRLRRECKILLLGTYATHLCQSARATLCASSLTITYRLRRERQVDHCEADEDYPSQRLLGR